MPFAFRTLFVVVPLRFWHAFAMSIDCDHHRGLGPRIDLRGRFRTVERARTVLQVGHAEIYAQTGIASEALNRADFPRQFGAAHQTKAWD